MQFEYLVQRVKGARDGDVVRIDYLVQHFTRPAKFVVANQVEVHVTARCPQCR